ncbi:CAP domain-containing protein [Paenibacillus wynnii]|uniref:CAP domain-containing protein n=1 Tax=Paenibacillus wynnii TaxID=268407 RepID=UPI00278E8189|nr:CAP domain-containing protein [Paenibacillus wynnii]MDQ0192910.1 putative YkwD family protein [Paenibacillus wynnii]
MKNKNLKALLIGGSLATVMAVSISLPSQASAATSSPIDLTNTRYEQILKYFQTYYSQSAPTVVVNTPVVTEQKAPVAPVAPTKTTPVVTQAPKSTPTTAVAAPKLTYTQQVVVLVNKERTAAGLKPVTGLDSLNKLAATKATDMRTNQYFSHTSPTYGSPFDMMGTFGITYRAAGENIAMGQKTPQEVMTAWMNSPGHRKNILSVDFNYIGVGFDNNYWVQEFIGK